MANLIAGLVMLALVVWIAVNSWPIWLFLIICLFLMSLVHPRKSAVFAALSEVLGCVCVGLGAVMALQLLYNLFNGIFGSDVVVGDVEAGLTSLYAVIAGLDKLRPASILGVIASLAILGHFWPKREFLDNLERVRNGISKVATTLLVVCSFTFFGSIPLKEIADTAADKDRRLFAALKKEELEAQLSNQLNAQLADRLNNLSAPEKQQFYSFVLGIAECGQQDKAEVAKECADDFVKAATLPDENADVRAPGEVEEATASAIKSPQEWDKLQKSVDEETAKVVAAMVEGDDNRKALKQALSACIDAATAVLQQAVPKPISSMFSDRLKELAGTYVDEMVHGLSEKAVDCLATRLSKNIDALKWLAHRIAPQSMVPGISAAEANIAEAAIKKADDRVAASVAGDVLVKSQAYKVEIDLAEAARAKEAASAIMVLQAAEDTEMAETVFEVGKLLMK